MVDKSKLSRDVEEQIQNLASDVYIQVEDKITNLIAAAVKAEISQTTDQQCTSPSDKELTLTRDINLLKLQLAEKQLDSDVNKQNFQVELTQNSINYAETIECLEKEIANLKKQETQHKGQQQSNDQKLEDKLLETEQKFNDKIQTIDGLNGRIMVLTEQEYSLTNQLNAAQERAQLSDKKHNQALIAITAQAETLANQKIDVLTEKLQQVESESIRIQAEVLQSSDSKVKALEQNVTQLVEQVQQEQNGKAELQQQLSEQQKSIDTEQDKNKKSEQKNQDFQVQIIKLTEKNFIDKKQLINEIKLIDEGAVKVKQLHLNDIEVLNEFGEQAKKLQVAAQQNIIELEKANEQLNRQLETEQNDIKLYQQEVTVLNDQVKIAQEGQENILNRFNSNRDKQEVENNKVRETIKFLRDENHQLISDNSEQKAQFSDQTNELEHKLTEYRLKFEYAQKQLTN